MFFIDKSEDHDLHNKEIISRKLFDAGQWPVKKLN